MISILFGTLLPTPSMTWTVSILRCGDGSLYTGVAIDVHARAAAHRAGKGARYTRSRPPVRLVYEQRMPDRSAALRRELAIKAMTRAEKAALVSRAGRGNGHRPDQRAEIENAG